jgi:thiamine kinase-like enzyme
MKWDRDRHVQNCEKLREAIGTHTTEARDFREELYQESRFLHMMLIQFAGEMSARKWNAAITQTQKDLADNKQRMQRIQAELREGGATLPNAPSPTEDVKDATGGQGV